MNQDKAIRSLQRIHLNKRIVLAAVYLLKPYQTPSIQSTRERCILVSCPIFATSVFGNIHFSFFCKCDWKAILDAACVCAATLRWLDPCRGRLQDGESGVLAGHTKDPYLDADFNWDQLRSLCRSCLFLPLCWAVIRRLSLFFFALFLPFCSFKRDCCPLRPNSPFCGFFYIARLTPVLSRALSFVAKSASFPSRLPPLVVGDRLHWPPAALLVFSHLSDRRRGP